MPKILIITASTRPGRFGPQPTAWVAEAATRYADKATFEIVDLASINLPFLDEPQPALYGNYQNDHTKAWANSIDQADGFIIVTPEYNHSFPAALKNAFDYLWKEWLYKPIAFVGYGAAAGGARSVEHLRGVAGNLKLFDMPEQVLIANYWAQLDDSGIFKANEAQEKDLDSLLKEIVFLSEKMQHLRTKN